MTKIHYSEVQAGDIIGTNPKHGKGPLHVDRVTIGPTGTVTILGQHTDTGEKGKKRVPDSGFVELL